MFTLCSSLTHSFCSVFSHRITVPNYLGIYFLKNLNIPHDMGTPKHIVVTVKVVFRGLTFCLTFISDENTVNYSGNALVFHPRCGASVSLFNGYRSAHRPRYGHYIVACVTLKSLFGI